MDRSRRSRPPAFGIARAIVVVVSFAVAGLTPCAPGLAVDPTSVAQPRRYAGLPLSQALRDLRARGLKIVFTTATVKRAMTVTAEPVAADPRRILDEILAPHGLTAREGPRGALVVVRLPATTHPPEPTARGDPGSLGPPGLETVRETVVVNPSRLSLLRDETAASVGFSRDEIEALPHLGDDFFRAVSLAPGIAGNDVSAKFHVRGARRDETQILLDGQELYDPFHLKDYDSALSFVASATLSRVDLTTGGFSAAFGDRMAGVLEMTTITPTGRLRGRAGASALSVDLGGAGAWRDDRTSLIFEARRGTTDLVNKLLGDEDPRYGDGYAKLQMRLGERQRLTGHFLFSDDELRFAETSSDESKRTETGYRSAYVWLTHQAIFGSSLVVDTSVSRAGIDQDRYGREIEDTVEFEVTDLRRTSVLGARQAFRFEASERHFLEWGWELREFDTAYDYASSFDFHTPLATIRDTPGAGSTVFDGQLESTQSALWVSHRTRVAEPLTLELGLRRDSHGLTDETRLSPRANLVWTPGPAHVLRAAWGRFLQSQRTYELQVEDRETDPFPTERAEHRVLGYEHVFGLGPAADAPGADAGMLMLRLEAYERRIDNPRPRFENLYEALNTFPELEEDRVRIDPDRSRARGVELLLQGRAGERIGWFANYTLAWTEDEISGDWIPRSIDQRHTLNLDLDVRFGRSWRVNVAWRYHSAWPTTAIQLREETDDGGDIVFVPVLGPLYGERLSDYHRLDLRASREFLLRRGRLLIFADVQNVYDRQNLAGFDITIDEEEGTLEREPESWAGILPSLGVTYEF